MTLSCFEIYEVSFVTNPRDQYSQRKKMFHGVFKLIQRDNFT